MVTDFGKFCRKLRIDSSESQQEMAEKLGVTSSYLSAIELGKRSIPEDFPEKIAELYELDSERSNELVRYGVLGKMTEREKEALGEAVAVLYFNDSSDYVNGLWGVVRTLMGHNVVINEGFNIGDLYTELKGEDD